MTDIIHRFQINSPVEEVFRAISSPDGVSHWWSLNASGVPDFDQEYQLDFGPGYHWKAKVAKYTRNKNIEWLMLDTDSDWEETSVGFELEPADGITKVRFYHKGWKENNHHYETSSFCWAMYLRILKRYVEYGESVKYEDRLNV